MSLKSTMFFVNGKASCETGKMIHSVCQHGDFFFGNSVCSMLMTVNHSRGGETKKLSVLGNIHIIDEQALSFWGTNCLWFMMKQKKLLVSIWSEHLSWKWMWNHLYAYRPPVNSCQIVFQVIFFMPYIFATVCHTLCEWDKKR